MDEPVYKLEIIECVEISGKWQTLHCRYGARYTNKGCYMLWNEGACYPDIEVTNRSIKGLVVRMKQESGKNSWQCDEFLGWIDSTGIPPKEDPTP